MSKKAMKKWFKIYEKIYNQTNKADEKMILKQDLFGIELKVERYPNTWCVWKQSIYYKKNKEVYRVNKDDKGIRREYFFKQKTPFREWKGDKFCFVEYLEFIEQIKRWPSVDEVYSEFGLDKNIAGKYNRFILKIKHQ
jgi:hypothetical protein